jgi:hypothetical protein
MRSADPARQFPFTSSREESQFREWEAGYSAAAKRYATCRYLKAFGSGGVASELDELIEYHDKETNAAAAYPLA